MAGTVTGSSHTVDYQSVPFDQQGHHYTWRYGDGSVHLSVITTSAGPDLSCVLFHNLFSCSTCGGFPGSDVIDFYDTPDQGPRLVARTSCPLPDGTEWSVQLVVPSGRLIVSDDLRPVYSVPLRDQVGVPGYNSVAGQELHCREMERLGCAFGPTSNIALGLYRLPAAHGPDRYVIASVDEEAGPGAEGHLDAVQVADICTNLWAYALADLGAFTDRARAMAGSPDYQPAPRYEEFELGTWLADGADPTALPDDMTVVDVTPGTYRFTHHGGRPGFTDRPWPLIWASVERVP